MLGRKLWRDLLANKTQFVSIFLMAFLGMWIFVGMDSESSGGLETIQQYYAETNLADYWMMGNSFSVDEKQEAESIPGVAAAERRLIVTGEADLSAKADTAMSDEEADAAHYSMQIIFVESQEISKMVLCSGESFKEGKSGIWIEELFAKAHDLKPGDVLKLKYGDTQFEGMIKGLVRHPEYVYYLSEEETIMPNYANYGYVILSESDYPNPDGIVYNQMLIKSDDTVDVEDDAQKQMLKKRIEKAIDRDSVVITDRKQNASYAMFDSEIQQHKTMGAMFSVVFLLIAVLGIVTTMTRMTANQRTQIGTLKALGFSKKVITRHYISYGFWISLMGSVIGAATGYFSIPPLVFMAFEGSYIVPRLGASFSPASLGAIILSVAVSTCVSYFACRKELADPPAVTLKPAAPKKITHTALEKSKFWLRLNFSTQWNFRDVLRNKARTVMGMVGVCGCTMLMLGAFGCSDAIVGMLDWMYGELMTGQNKIMLNEQCDYSTALDYANEYKGQMVQETAVEFIRDDVCKTGTLTVVDTGNYLHYQGEKMEPIRLTKSGVAMSYRMATSLGIRPGDVVKWHIVGEDEWETTRISQIYRDPSVQGIVMRRATFETMEHDFVPTSILTNQTPKADITDDAKVQAVMNISEMKQAFMKSIEIMNLMIGLMVGGAVILGVVVLYNLGVLSFVEKMREIATLKVLGFQSKKIRAILQKQNIWVTVAGILIGLPAGYGLLIGICSTMPDTMDMVPELSMLSYLYSIGGTFLVSVSVNFFLSGKVKTIDMVDALKGVE